MPFLPIRWRSTLVPCASSCSIRRRASRIRFALKAPHSPRLDVTTTSATRRPALRGCRNSGNRSASSGAYSSASTSARAAAYGLAAITRSWARLSFEVATSSMVRVILRVFCTDLIRRRNSRGFAILARRDLLVLPDGGLEPRRQVVAEHLAAPDFLGQLRMPGAHEVAKPLLPGFDLRDRHVVEKAVRDGEDDHDLLLDRHRLVLRLLQHLHHAGAAGELLLGGLVELGAELGERLELAVLRQIEPQASRHLFHRLDLSVASHARHRTARVDR